jgi:hypothetical protein
MQERPSVDEMRATGRWARLIDGLVPGEVTQVDLEGVELRDAQQRINRMGGRRGLKIRTMRRGETLWVLLEGATDGDE